MKAVIDTGHTIDTDKITHACGATSSQCPDLAQIPFSALESLAARFEEGEKKHGRDNWRRGAGNESYVKSRLSHGIRHLYRLIGKIEGKIPWDGDDDAGAVLWCGAFAVEALQALGYTKDGPISVDSGFNESDADHSIHRFADDGNPHQE